MTFVLIGVRAFLLEGSTTKIKDIHSFQVYRYIPRSEMVWSSEAQMIEGTARRWWQPEIEIR